MSVLQNLSTQDTSGSTMADYAAHAMMEVFVAHIKLANTRTYFMEIVKPLPLLHLPPSAAELKVIELLRRRKIYAFKLNH
ncbi:hypothetical protein F441_18571 [Phytophthora nicotianae CJ01A1]|nr:hypothetical protein F441_18571 [Phytophthora nicotianae CJ01A1]